MESEWVRIMDFIEKPLPPTAVNSDFPGVSESKEIYEYFSSKDSKMPIEKFRMFYANLPAVPRLGQSKMDQVMEAIRLCKLSDKIQSQMNHLGIK